MVSERRQKWGSGIARKENEMPGKKLHYHRSYHASLEFSSDLHGWKLYQPTRLEERVPLRYGLWSFFGVEWCICELVELLLVLWEYYCWSAQSFYLIIMAKRRNMNVIMMTDDKLAMFNQLRISSSQTPAHQEIVSSSSATCVQTCNSIACVSSTF